MRRRVLALVVLAACDSEADARYRCTKFTEENPVFHSMRPEPWIDECVKGRWSPRQMDCQARPGRGSLLGMFSDCD